MDRKTLIKRLKKEKKKLSIPFIDNVIRARKKDMSVDEVFTQLGVKTVKKFDMTLVDSKISLSHDSIALINYFLDSGNTTFLHMLQVIKKTPVYTKLSRKIRRKLSDVMSLIQQYERVILKKEIQTETLIYSTDITSRHILENILQKITNNRELSKKEDQLTHVFATSLQTVFQNTGVESKILTCFMYFLDDDYRSLHKTIITIIKIFFKDSESLETLDVLLPLLRDHNSTIRNVAIEAIGAIFNGSGHEMEAIARLVPLFSDYSQDVRSATAETIGAILKGFSATKTLKALKSLLHGYSPEVRSAAIKAIGVTLKGSGVMKALKTLATLLRDDFSNVRSAAAEAIGTIFNGSGHEMRALKELMPRLHNSKPHIASAAAEAVGAIFKGSGNIEVLNILVPLLSDFNLDVKIIATAIGNIFRGTNHDLEALEILIRLLDNSEWWVRSAATEAIAAIFRGTKNKYALNALKPMLHDANSIVRRVATEAVEKIKGDYI